MEVKESKHYKRQKHFLIILKKYTHTLCVFVVVVFQG